MERPIIEFSSAINQWSAQIAPLESTLYRYRAIIESLNTQLRETIGVAAEVASYQIETIREFQTFPPRERDYSWIQTTLQRKLTQMKVEYIDNYTVLINARDGYFENGRLITFTYENRQALIQRFREKLDEQLQDFQQEFVVTEATPLERLEHELEEKISVRRQVYDTLFEEQTQLTMEELRQQELIGPQYEACLAERQRLRQGLEAHDLYSACQLGKIAYVRTHIQGLRFFQRKTLNDLDARGFAPLHYAVYHGRLDIVRLLLDAGAKLSTPDQCGYQPLHRAAQNGQLAVIEELLNRGASINARGEYGRTPLHMSVFNGKIESTRLLLARGADVNAQTEAEDGFVSPIYDAVTHGHEQMVATLVPREDLNVLVRDRVGETPLHFALKNGLPGIARLLLEHGSFVHEAFVPPLGTEIRRGDIEGTHELLMEFNLLAEIKLE